MPGKSPGPAAISALFGGCDRWSRLSHPRPQMDPRQAFEELGALLHPEEGESPLEQKYNARDSWTKNLLLEV